MHHNEWANALDQFWTGEREPGARVVLMLEKRLLRRVAKLAGFGDEDEDSIEQRLLESVKSYISDKCLGPWHSEPFRPETPPRFLLQIAVQIYAASKMADDPDGDYTTNAYYVQLKKLVGDLGDAATINRNKGEHHQQLWGELRTWAKHKDLELCLPTVKEFGAGRHVQLPKSQSALRVGDLERLPLFFHQHKLCPCSEKELSSQLPQLRRKIEKYSKDSKYFSKWAMRVLEDGAKREVAMMQIEDALASWNGELVLATASQERRRSTTAEPLTVWISIRRQQQVVTKLGSNAATARRLSEGEFGLLLAGKAVDSHSIELRGGHFSFYKYCEEGAAFRSVEYLHPGDRCLIASLTATDADWCMIGKEENTLFHIEREDFEGLEGLPQNARILEIRMIDSLPCYEDIAPFWLSFLQWPVAQLSLSGGLRVNRKECFITGAGPMLTLSSTDCPPFIYVNKKKVLISSRQVRLPDLSQPGEHEVAAWCDGKRLEKSFHVVIPDADLPTEFPSRCWRFFDGTPDDRWPVFGAHQSTEDAETSQPRLFGMRALNIEIKSVEPSKVENSQLDAIQLLCGLPVQVDLRCKELHPVVRTLAFQQPHVHQVARK